MKGIEYFQHQQACEIVEWNVAEKIFINNVHIINFKVTLEIFYELQGWERGISWKCIPRNGSIFQSNAVSRREFKRVLLDVQLPVGETHRCTRALQRRRRVPADFIKMKSPRIINTRLSGLIELSCDVETTR